MLELVAYALMQSFRHMSHRSDHDSLSSITTDTVTGGLQQKQNYDRYHHVHQLPPLFEDKPEWMILYLRSPQIWSWRATAKAELWSLPSCTPIATIAQWQTRADEHRQQPDIRYKCTYSTIILCGHPFWSTLRNCQHLVPDPQNPKLAICPHQHQLAVEPPAPNLVSNFAPLTD